MTDDTAANMKHIGYGQRSLPVHVVASADGTTIAYEKSGSGPAIVIVGGGLNEKAMHAELSERLSARFTVYNYDRRARGDSDNLGSGPYSLQWEIEDLAAVIAAADGPASVFANCTGSMVAVPAAAQGVPMEALAMYEPPYGGPKVPPGYAEELENLLESGRHSEAVAWFLRWDALFTDDEIEYCKTHPIWPAFVQMAPSIAFDTVLSDDADSVPATELSRIKQPILVLGGNDSPDWMLDACRNVAAGAPNGKFIGMPSAGHLMDDTKGTELLTEFFRGQPVSPTIPGHAPRSAGLPAGSLKG